MPLSFIVLLVEIGIAAALLALLVVYPGVARSVEGKILAVVALFVAPALAAYGGVSEHLNRSKTTSYCLSCHVMADYGKSLRVDDSEFLAAAHYQNSLVPRDMACTSCHMDYGMSGDMRTKARGFKHVVKTYFGSVSDTIRIARRYRNRDCLRCHLATRSFEESDAHHGPRASLADIKSGRASCMRSGCHHVVHNVHELDGMAFWDPIKEAARTTTQASWTPGVPEEVEAEEDSAMIVPGPRIK